ncbi:MAG: hypothetical protein V1664_02850 [Candidatus Uhrbacteria bacterium]
MGLLDQAPFLQPIRWSGRLKVRNTPLQEKGRHMPQNIQTEWSRTVQCPICDYEDATFTSGIGGFRELFCPFQGNEWHWKVSLTNERRNEIWRLIGQKKRLSDDPAQASSIRLELAQEIEGLEVEFAAISERLKAEIIEAHRLAIPAAEIRETAKKRSSEVEETVELFEGFRRALKLNLTFVPNDQTPKALRGLINGFGGNPTSQQVTKEIEKLWTERQTLIREHRLKTD